MCIFRVCIQNYPLMNYNKMINRKPKILFIILCNIIFFTKMLNFDNCFALDDTTQQIKGDHQEKTEIKDYVNYVFYTIKEMQDNMNPEDFDVAAKKFIRNIIDVEWMVSHVIGLNTWDQMTQEDKGTILELYFEYLFKKNLIALKKMNNNNLIVKNTEVDSNTQIYKVYSIFITGNDNRINIIFSLHYLDGILKFFNLSTEGIDLYINSRIEFRNIIDQQGIPGLIRYLNKRINT